MRLCLLVRLRLFMAALVLAAGPAVQAQSADAADASEKGALHRVFDAAWQANTERYPEWATFRGDHRYNDRLSDASAEAEARDFARLRDELAAARAIRPERLGASDRLSRELFIAQAEQRLAMQPFEGWRSLELGSSWGLQSQFAGLLRVVPMARAEHAEQLLARMAAYPRQMQQHIDRMRRGMALGWVSSADVLARVLEQIDAQMPADVEAGPFYAPFKRLGSGIAPAERARLQAAGRAAVERDVLPALRRLRAFVADEYLPKAPADGALRRYPDGARVYDALVREHTTTSLSAAEVHAIGQRELQRIRGEMDAVIRQLKFDGGFDAFVRHLNTDPKFFPASAEALLDHYRMVSKRFDAEMPRLFAELPRAAYGVRGMPQHLGPDAAEYYESPASDGSTPGWFNANLVGWRSRPLWGVATLVAHEAVPGHHLQSARALELKNLPEFRRDGDYTAYGEGWALYAETLAREVGLYDDPYSLFGHLQWQAFRAARLVVDTGIHALGWSRQQAIAYMVERTGVGRDFVSSEVDRYVSNPGQALAYMIGALKFQELRQRASTALGPKFDLRRFHNAVLDQGALPLGVLDRVVDDWIAAEANAAKR